MSDRCKELFSSIPLVTLLLLLLNLSIHAWVFLSTADIRPFTLNPYRVIYFYEFYRCISAALLHGGAMHILMNMMTLFSLGSSLERKFGSFHFSIFSMWTIFLCGILYCLQSWLLTKVTGSMSYLMQPAVGYSGVLFAYIFIECHHATVTSRSFFGMFSVPTKLYPWIILVVMQFVMPNISFLGHLSGILVGLMAVYGVIDCLMPSYAFVAACETSSSSCSCFNTVYRCSNYVSAVDCPLKVSSGFERDQNQSVGTQICSGLKWVVVTVWHFVSTVLFIIGCPVDTCAAVTSQRYAITVNYVNSFSNPIRNVFDTDAPSTSLASPGLQQTRGHTTTHVLDTLEAGRGMNSSEGIGSDYAGSASNTNRCDHNTSGNNNTYISTHGGRTLPSQAEAEAHRKSAREARLQKFAQGYTANTTSRGNS